jgi:HK97 family phage major capsid protein
MLESLKIQRRQSEIRQSLAALVAKPELTEDETRSIEALDAEYRGNETKYRGALIAEDTERRDAKGELETRSDRDYADLIGKFEMRQVALHLDEGRALDGATAEVVQELRSQGGYQGVPVPWLALEQRSGETIASGTPSPTVTAPIIDRLFPASAAARMGAQMITIDQGTNEYPLTSSAVTAGWAASETGAVAGPTAYATANRALAPNSTLGITMKITRKTLKQSGDALEQAVRRDMSGAIGAKLDAAVFLGAGSTGEPLGIIPGQSTYGYATTAVADAATWAAFRAAVVAFMTGNAITSPADVRLLMRPEIFGFMDDTLIDGTAVSEWDRLLKNIPLANIVMSSNALAAPTGTPKASTCVLTTATGGVAPIFVGVWGGVDLIRDVYSDAASGGLRLTALVTADVTAGRAPQIATLTGVQSEAAE